MSYRATPTSISIFCQAGRGQWTRSKRNGGQDASVLIDATLKENFPPISLPKREFMEQTKDVETDAHEASSRISFVRLSLGEWSDEMDETARRATRGDYFETGVLLEKRRRKDVRMNTEVRNVDERKPRPLKRKRS